MSPPRTRALVVSAIVGGYAVLLAALFWRVWLRGQMSGWDCVVEYWPDVVFQLHALGDGEWPMWNPYALGGYPAVADVQAGLFAPVNWLLWLGSVPFGDGPWLIQAKVLINLLVGLTGMHAWVWWRRRSHAAAVVAALVFVLGSPLLVHKNGALLWPFLYVPWAMLALERFVAHPSARRGAALAAAVWLMGTAGHPQSFFYGLVALTVFGVALALTAPGGPRGIAALARRAWPGLLVAGGLALLLLAATWQPAREAVSESPRAHRGLGYVLGGAMETSQLRELVAPGLDTNWQTDVYVGALPLVGGLWWLLVARGWRERARAAAWWLVGGLGLALALGRDGHLLPWFAEHVPGFDLFRIAYRHKLMFGLAAAVLAGDATAALLAPGDAARARWTRLAWLGLAAAWLGLAATVAWRPTWWALAAGTLAVVAAPAWLPAAARWARWARAGAAGAVVAIVLCDLWLAGAFKLAILQRRPDPARHAAVVAAMTGVDRDWRYHVGNMSSPYGGTVPYHMAFLGELREWSGYINPIEPERHVELEKRSKREPALLAHFNVRYLAGHKAPPPGATPVTAPGVRGVVALDDVAPVARWYGAVERRARKDVLGALAASPPSARTAALVEPDVAGLDALPAAAPDAPVDAPVDGRLVAFARNALVVDVDAPAPGLVVINEAYAAGWTAEVITADGRRAPAPVVRAHYHLRGVVVPAGTVRVVLRYEPPGYAALVMAFFVGLAALALAALGRWRWLDATPGAPR